MNYNDSSVCNKNVTCLGTLACLSCNHKKCIGKFKNRIEYQNFLQYYSNRQWECPFCMAEKLPFTLLEDRDFILLLLDVLYDQPRSIYELKERQIFENT